MATRKVTLTIPENLATRLDAYPGNLKLSAFLQEKLSEFLDAEDVRAVALLKERQTLDDKALNLVMAGQYADAYEAGRLAGRSWAESLTPERLTEAHAESVLNPYPLEFGRPDLLPKSLLDSDLRLKSYIETMLGREIMNTFLSTPEPVFILPSGKKDEALVWIFGWNTGLEEIHRDHQQSEWMSGGPSAAASPMKPSRRKRPLK